MTSAADVMALNFDANGNRTSVVNDGGTTAYTTNNLNQISSVGGVSATYDANGNLATASNDGAWTYTYDAENRLTRAQSTGMKVEYYYDGFNRQIAKEINDVRTYNVWDGWDLIQEYNASNTLQYYYQQGAGTDEMWRVLASAIGARKWIAQRLHMGTASYLSLFLLDDNKL